MENIYLTLTRWWNMAKRAAAMLFAFPFHPILLAIAPILILFQLNSRELPLYELTLPSAIAIFVSSSLFLLFQLIFRTWRKAALAVSVLITIFYGYGYAKDALHNYVYGFLHINQYSYPEDEVLSRVGVILFIAFLLWLYTRTFQFKLTSKVVNIFGIALVLWPLLQISPLIAANFGSEYHSISQNFYPTSSISRKPNIYYIVPEDYASDLILKHFFNFDNSSFTSYLKSQGFTVNLDMLTNYPISSMSIASMLSMNYVQTFTPDNNDPRDEISKVFPRLQDPLVGSYLQQQGYTFIQMSSWYEPTRTSDIADENINFSTNQFVSSEFQRLVLDHTIVGPYLSKTVSFNEYKQQLEGVNYEFDKFPSVISQPGPKFVFAHIIMPHEPTVFGKNCKLIPADKVAFRTPARNYLGQINCLNLHLESIVSQIRNSDPNAVIVLQSDEGVPGESIRMKDGEYAFANSSTEVRLARTSLLDAWYMPKPDGAMLTPGQTPINTFRILFNTYFGTHYRMLPDKTYLMPDANHLFDFIDATDELNQAQASL